MITQYFNERADRIALIELIMLAPPLIAAALRHAARRPWRTTLLVNTQYVTAGAALAAGLAVAFRSDSAVSYGMIGAAAVVGGCATAGIFWTALGRDTANAGAALNSVKAIVPTSQT